MTLPTVGGGEDAWGTTLNAHINVGHSSDGTHNQEDWSPTSYAGEESVTLPNGLIMKMGRVAVSTASGTITYEVAFPTALISVTMSVREDGGSTGHTVSISNPTITQLPWGVNSASTIDHLYWIAIGY